MKIRTVAYSAMLLLLGCTAAFAEHQIRDMSGRVVEIRQPYGNTSYAYDGYRNPIYTAIDTGKGGVMDYRDKYGVHVGVGGPGAYPWAVRGTWGAK